MNAPAAQPDHYAALGLPPTATSKQITDAYRTLVRTLHPDTTTAPEDTLARFTAVTTAYALLHDPVRRAAYDKTRHSPPSVPHALPQTGSTIHITVLPAPTTDTTPANPRTRRDTTQPLLRAGPTRVSPLPHRGP